MEQLPPVPPYLLADGEALLGLGARGGLQIELLRRIAVRRFRIRTLEIRPNRATDEQAHRTDRKRQIARADRRAALGKHSVSSVCRFRPCDSRAASRRHRNNTSCSIYWAKA